jgi:hypothetical protein
VFGIVGHFHPGPIIASKTVVYLKWLYSKGKLVALPANTRLGWRCATMANTLAYYSTELIAAVKCFLKQIPRE